MDKNDIPAYRIIALANLDLEEHMTDHPLTISGPQRVKWDVEETDYHYIAKGTIRIPVEIYFSKPEGEEDPEIRRVIIAGKRKFDARLDELDEEEKAERSPKKKNYGLDENKVHAETFVHYKKNLKS